MTWGDVRDQLEALPHHWSGGSYRYSGQTRAEGAPYNIFLPRYDIAKGLGLAFAGGEEIRIFEFGALVGYCLATMILGAEAAGAVPVVGWCDDESYSVGTNADCADNLRSLGVEADLVVERREHAARFGYADLVSVDGDHSYEGCMADLAIAAVLQPSVILVDDHIPEHDEVRQAVRDFVNAGTGTNWRPVRIPTVNGLMVLERFDAIVSNDVSAALSRWEGVPSPDAS